MSFSPRPPRRHAASLSFLCLGLLLAGGARSQHLPPPSRTVFKCESGGKTVYSDSPCLGAQKLQIEPTRGLNGDTGQKRVGADVRHEMHREAMAEALKPITGMDARQLDVAGRRMRLPAASQQTCRELDSQIAGLEASERAAAAARSTSALPDIQARLLDARGRFRSLRC